MACGGCAQRRAEREAAQKDAAAKRQAAREQRQADEAARRAKQQAR